MLIDVDSQVIAEATIALPVLQYHGNRIEQDPHVWWDTLGRVLTMLRSQIKLDGVHAVAVAGTSGTVLLADANGAPLGPALMYNDGRAVDQSNQLAHIAPADSPVSNPNSGLAKLVWLAQQPGSDKAHYFLHQADWIAGKLAGRPGYTDPNNALKSGYDPLTGHWPAWLDQLPFPPAWLPKVQACGSPIGTVDSRIAALVGLPRETLIVAGTTDSTASFIATGASKTGEAVTVLGSTLVLKVISETPVSHPHYGIYSQPLEDKWLVGGASNSGGAVLQHFFSDKQMAEMELQLEPDTPTGLDYYPLITPGERFPINDPHFQPRLSPRPENEVQFFQGLLEGIANIERLGYERLRECGAPWPVNLRTTGGGVRNAAWTRIRSNMLNVPLLTASHTQAAFGAAQLARQGFTTRNVT